ncbi:peptide-binding protein [soil metagenome]
MGSFRATHQSGLPAINRRQLLQNAAAGAAVLALAGVGVDRVSASPATSGKLLATSGQGVANTLIEGGALQISALAPIVDANRATQFLYDTLTSVDAATLLPKPNLATEWTISEDGATYTFALKPDVTFHDGTPLTSADVKFTFELLLNPETASPYNPIFAGRILSVEAPDPLTAVFTLNGPVASFLVDLNAYSLAILPKHLVEGIAPAEFVSSEFAQSAPIGSGPFIFSSYTPGEALTLTANPTYHGGAPKIEQYVLKFLADTTAAYQQLKTGEVDVTQISADFYEDATAQTNFTAATFDTLEQYIFGFNVDPEKGSPVLQDLAVRQAIAYAIDRQTIIDRVFSGLGTLAIGTQPPISWAYQPDGITVNYDYDVEKAKSTLEADGWVLGDGDIREKDGVKASFTAIAGSTRSTDQGALLAIQEFLAEVGIELTPSIEEQSPLATQPGVRDFEAMLVSFTFAYDPDQSLAFDSAGIEAGYNLWGYNSPEADDLLHRGLQATSVEERTAIYTEFQNLILTDLPVFITHFSKGVTGVNNRVSGYNPSAVGYKWAAQSEAIEWSITE